jgi:hypothetical protein
MFMFTWKFDSDIAPAHMKELVAVAPESGRIPSCSYIKKNIYCTSTILSTKIVRTGVL